MRNSSIIRKHHLIYRSGPSIRDQLLLGVSLVIQLYAMGHITYYRWRYHRQDSQIPIFHITPPNQSGPNGGRPSHQPNQGYDETGIPRINNQAHNSILYEVKYMIFFAVFYALFTAASYTIGFLSKDDYYGIQPAIYYFEEFGPGLLLNVLYPCCFYITNVDARMYFKKIFFKSQKIIVVV